MQMNVTGFFSDEDTAAEAVRELVDSHFEQASIGVVAASERGSVAVPVERRTGVPVGAGRR
jgi:hypothetical protein